MPLATRTWVADRETRLVHIGTAVNDGDGTTGPLSGNRPPGLRLKP